jgi:hypothetical protein
MKSRRTVIEYERRFRTVCDLILIFITQPIYKDEHRLSYDFQDYFERRVLTMVE